MKKKETFGNFVKEKRLQNKISLREFCKKADFDPSNWSKIERDLAMPPKSETILKKISNVLDIKSGSEDFLLLHDLAAFSSIPKGLIENNKLLEKLPVFFRTARGEKPTKKELADLLNLIKQGWKKVPLSLKDKVEKYRELSQNNDNDKLIEAIARNINQEFEVSH